MTGCWSKVPFVVLATALLFYCSLIKIKQWIWKQKKQTNQTKQVVRRNYNDKASTCQTIFLILNSKDYFYFYCDFLFKDAFFKYIFRIGIFKKRINPQFRALK